MQIELRRLKANHLYTEGQLIINDLKTVPYTVEHTFTMLPIGKYLIRLTKDKKRRRVLGIFPIKDESRELKVEGKSINPKPSTINLLAYFEAGHSFLSSKINRSIIIGELLIPGSVKKGREHYDRLFDRIEKCEQRDEPITLTISDTQCEESQPIAHWLR